MKNLLRALLDKMAAGEDTVLTAIAANAGSTPREAGAAMLTGTEGRLAGTVGGGVVERLAEEEAIRCIHERRSARRGYLLHPDEDDDLGARCGGELNLCFIFMDAADKDLAQTLQAALDSYSRSGPSWLVMELREGPGRGAIAVEGEGGVTAGAQDAPRLTQPGAALAEAGGAAWLSIPLAGRGFIYIFGGGHISQELVPLLTRLGFRCAVFDDRREFLTRKLFPQAERLVCGDYGRIGRGVALSREDGAVIVTRGHAFDYQALAFALATEAFYIGVIGSLTKLDFVNKRLQEEAGFTEAALRSPRVHAPIGLPIGSKTPPEIAVSIAAELIQERSRSAAGKP